MIERLLAADAALDRDDLERAHGLFTQVVTADPRNAIAVVGLARVAIRRGAADEARELLARALEIDPEEAAARRLLAEMDARAAVSAAVPALAPVALLAPVASLAPAAAPEAPPAPHEPAPRRSGWRGWLARILRRR